MKKLYKRLILILISGVIKEESLRFLLFVYLRPGNEEAQTKL